MAAELRIVGEIKPSTQTLYRQAYNPAGPPCGAGRLWPLARTKLHAWGPQTGAPVKWVSQGPPAPGSEQPQTFHTDSVPVWTIWLGGATGIPTPRKAPAHCRAGPSGCEARHSPP